MATGSMASTPSPVAVSSGAASDVVVVDGALVRGVSSALTSSSTSTPALPGLAVPPRPEVMLPPMPAAARSEDLGLQVLPTRVPKRHAEGSGDSSLEFLEMLLLTSVQNPDNLVHVRGSKSPRTEGSGSRDNSPGAASSPVMPEQSREKVRYFTKLSDEQLKACLRICTF